MMKADKIFPFLLCKNSKNVYLIIKFLLCKNSKNVYLIIMIYIYDLFFLCSFTDYAAMLSRHSSLSPTTSQSVATGRFYFRKKTLSYSFVTSPNFGFPAFLTFLDEDNNIIEEFPLRPTHFQVRSYII